jgi:hypothetical protein
LERLRTAFGGDSAARKRTLLTTLARGRLASAAQVQRLHELLCFMRAYPDDAGLQARVEHMLAGFARRPDVRAHRAELAYSGIAGTDSWFPFFYPTARWLAQRWPAQLVLDRDDTEAERSIARALPLLVTPLEGEALRAANLGGYAAIDRLRARGQTDAAFLIERVAALPGNELTREAFYDAINPSCILHAAPTTPSRTLAHAAWAPRALQRAPLRRGRPDLHAEIARAPQRVRRLSPAQGAHAIDLARGAMVTRQRDLDAFAYGNARDVWLAEHGGGLALALVGIEPARRAVLMTSYGFLTLQNGVPIGYGQIDLLGRAAALAFNTFETFRGGEAAYTFARLLATFHHHFGATSFSADPYQLGQDNDEALESGAWWFYAKLGFRPRDAAAGRLAQQEIERAQRAPAHRSSLATLRRLAAHAMYFEYAGGAALPPVAVTQAAGLRVARWLVRQGDRDTALEAASRTALAHCVDSMRAAATPERTMSPVTGSAAERALFRAWSAAARAAWLRASPLLCALDIARWSDAERRALVQLVRAKGAPSEREFVLRFAAHARLRRALGC